MVLADALAIIVGAYLGKKLPERVIKLGATVAFVVFGVVLIVQGPSMRWPGWRGGHRILRANGASATTNLDRRHTQEDSRKWTLCAVRTEVAS
jgi:hypothetical protein